jgi:hypothetical protein
MGLFTDTDLQPFRELFVELACDQECTISRPGNTADGYGTQSPGTPTVIATVDVFVHAPGVTEGSTLQVHSLEVSSLAMWQVDFPYGADVQEKDLLTFAGSTKTLIVQELLEPKSFPIVTSVLASEAQ